MPNWKEVAGAKCLARDRALDKAQTTLATEKDLQSDTLNHFTRADATLIVQNIQNKEPGWTALAVMKAYIQRAIVAQKETNCLTEIMFDGALAEAKALDEEFASTGHVRGPLHGVPFSAKDLFEFPGFDATIGFTRWANKPSTVESEMVQLVRAAGGIFFAKTNVPQTMLSFECQNPLWGRTLNPLKSDNPPAASGKEKKTPSTSGQRHFTSGGSSGGEAALLACDGAAMGLGTDIGGSLRIPTHFCGVYAIKPSPNRTSGANTVSPARGMDALTVCQGPMGRSVADIKLGCQVLLGKLSCKVPIPYRDDIAAGLQGKKLKFGYYLSDEVVKASPACQRAVVESVDALRAAGHECVLFRPPNVREAMRVFIALTSADGYKTLLSHLGSDPTEESLFLVTLGPKLPGFVRKTAASVIMAVTKDETFVTLLKNSKPRGVRSYMKACQARDAYIAMWEREVWEKMGFDGIIAPVNASPALPHGATKTLSPLAVGTILYNIVDSPVGVIPVTRVDPVKDVISDEWRSPSNSPDLNAPHPSGPRGSKMIEEGLYDGSLGTPRAYDPKAMAGLPVGVQIVGRLYEDEKVLEMMRIVDDALGERGFGPGGSARYL